MNARVLVQKWLAEGHGPETVLPCVVHDLLNADEDAVPHVLRAMTYMVEAMVPRSAAVALIEAMRERRFLPQEGEVHGLLRAELARMAEAGAVADERLKERQTQMRNAEQQAAELAAEVARLRAVLAVLPQAGGDGEQS